MRQSQDAAKCLQDAHLCCLVLLLTVCTGPVRRDGPRLRGREGAAGLLQGRQAPREGARLLPTLAWRAAGALLLPGRRRRRHLHAWS